MKRIFGVLMVAGLVLTGCKESSNNNKDGGGGTDMKVSGGDMSTTPKAATGEPCTKNADCAGNLCLTENMGVFKGGYCSKSCTLGGTQCGDDDCYPISSTQNVCVKPCTPSTDFPDRSPADCRTGYACWTDGVCLPPIKDYFVPEALCNPTTFTNANCAAGEVCRRLEHAEDGSGVDKGLCFPTCVVGTDTCGTEDGQACVMVDNKQFAMADNSTKYTGDVGVAPECKAWNTDVVTANAVGATCEISLGSDTANFAFACVEEAQCAISDDMNWFGLGDPKITGGDDKCHVLCYKDGAKPVLNPDAGQEGTPFVACPGGTVCKDSFGVFGNTNGLPQVGLCLAP